MVTNTQQDVLLAWKTFIASGIILEDRVRPIIARSWVRCRDASLDPWSSDYPKSSNSLLAEKRAFYADFLAVAQPVMNYACLLLNNNISICDADGFIFELNTPLKYYPRTLGTYIEEATCGNGAVTIALHEHVPAITDGYEHYRVISHSHSDVSAPYYKGNEFMGCLNAVSPFRDLPEKALQMIIAAAKILELHLKNDRKMPVPLETTRFFKEMIDCCPQGVVVLNGDGAILDANLAFAQLLGYPVQAELLFKPFARYLSDSDDLSELLSYQSGLTEKPIFHLKTLDKDKNLKSLLIRKKKINMLNGDVHSVLMIDKYGRNDTAQTNTSFAPVSPNTRNITSPGVYSVNFTNYKQEEANYIGESQAWAKVNDMVMKVAPFPSHIMLQGESGTGKEIVALSIHRLSQRKGKFVAINCGAIPKELLYSELFGYEKGAFTGAQASGSIGKFEYAHEGTLFLDEIGEMPLDMQVSLLRFIQELTVTRIGSNKSKKVDVRIIAATNRDLTELIKAGRFREDLYYRLSVIDIKLPPLREHKSDIPLLANYFVAKFAKQFDMQPIRLSEKVMQALNQYDWPGNVRELKNVLEKTLVLSGGQDITPEQLPERILNYCGDHNCLDDNSAGIDGKRELLDLLEHNGYNISKTAKALNITRNTLYRRIEKYNIKLKTSVLKGSNEE